MLAEAITEFRETLRIKQDCPDTHHNLGVALFQKGLLDEAIAEFREAIRIKKDDAVAHTGLGGALARKGLLDDAITEYRKAIRINKDYALAHYSLGLTLADKGLLDDAIAAYKAAIRLEPDLTDAHYWLGITLTKKGLLSDAIAAYRQAIAVAQKRIAQFPGRADDHSTLGAVQHQLAWLFVGRNELMEARRLLEQALEHQMTALKLSPGNAHYRQSLLASGLPILVLRMGDHAGAAKVAEGFLRVPSAGWSECHWAAIHLDCCVPVAENDAKLSESERRALAKKYAVRARELLREAIKRGAPVVHGALEAELLAVAESKRCRPRLQSTSSWIGGKWSNACQLFCPAEKGGYVVLEVELPRSGRYQLAIQFTKAPSHGTVEVNLCGSKIGELFDGYAANFIPSGEVAFGIVELKAGKQQIRFTAVDKIPKSTNYFMGIDYLRLEPVK